MSEEYVKLYKYTTTNRLDDILTNNRIYLSNGSNFNDPFEMKVFDRTTSTYRIINNLHILCLTNSYQNKLMWAHYADSSRGVCLTIKVPKRLVYPVCYTSARVFSDSNINYIVEHGKNRQLKTNLNKSLVDLSNDVKIAHIKDHRWLYENEYRIVFDNDNGLINDEGNWFMPVKITQVYLGVNFSKNSVEEIERVKDLCSHNNIPIKEMRISDSKYVVKPISAVF